MLRIANQRHPGSPPPPSLGIAFLCLRGFWGGPAESQVSLPVHRAGPGKASQVWEVTKLFQPDRADCM